MRRDDQAATWGRGGDNRAAAGADATGLAPAAGPALPKADNTPDGITGCRCTPGGVSRVDWFTGTAPEGKLPDLLAVLRRYFGQSTHERGQRFYSRGIRFESGAVLRYGGVGGAEGTACVDLNGSSLGTLEPTAVLELLRELVALGVRPSRTDHAFDVFGDVTALLRSLAEAYQRRELMGYKCVRPFFEFINFEQVLTGLMFGKRGKDSTCVRVYDKGYQTKSAALGSWVRFEAEYRGKAAANATVALLVAHGAVSRDAESLVDGVQHGEGWEEFIRRTVVGALEFREAGRHHARSRRPIAAWWATFCDGIRALRLRVAAKLQTSLDGTKRWFRRSVAPLVAALMRATSRTLDQVVADLAGDLAGVRSSFSPAVREYVSALTTGPGDATGGRIWEGVPA